MYSIWHTVCEYDFRERERCVPFSFHAVDHAVDRGLPDVPCPVARVPYLSIASTQLPVISILLLKSRKQKITLKRTSHSSCVCISYFIHGKTKCINCSALSASAVFAVLYSIGNFTRIQRQCRLWNSSCESLEGGGVRSVKSEKNF